MEHIRMFFFPASWEREPGMVSDESVLMNKNPAAVDR